jgi:hypothetical protein
MIILKAREPVLIVNSILKAPISKRVWAALVDIPLEKQELISNKPRL